MRGVFLHILSDAIGSVFVIVTASLALFLPDALGRLNDYLDPALRFLILILTISRRVGTVIWQIRAT